MFTNGNSLYRSFSQLAADNQYATLGLMLLVVIARVNTILNNLLPTEEPTPTRPAIEPPIKNASISKPIGGDKGVKVQRDGTEDTPATTQSAEQALKRGPLPVEVPKKKRKKKSKDEFSSLFGSLA